VKRTAFVTGANGGIGLAIARQLAERGYSVLLGSRDPKSGEDAAESLRRIGLDAAVIRIDLNAPATIDTVVEDIHKSARHIDVLVNNAGVLHEKPLLELTDGEIAESIAALYERAWALGLHPDNAPRDAAWGERYFHLTDPDGHQLSFAKPIELRG
jgi:NAD(P)-dependent dehydrogenase (short-subunit alcohol dehydrogenase family)